MDHAEAMEAWIIVYAMNRDEISSGVVVSYDGGMLCSAEVVARIRGFLSVGDGPFGVWLWVDQDTVLISRRSDNFFGFRAMYLCCC